LLVLIVIILLLASIVIPYIRKARENEQRTRCLTNLWTIGSALREYAKSNNGNFPRVVYDPVNYRSGYFAYTGPYAPNPFAGDGRVSVNDVTASLWLLVRGGYSQPAEFICPSSSDLPDPMLDGTGQKVSTNSRSNFRRARHLSYSYASPFSSAPGYKLNEYQPSEFAILADKNPGRSGGQDVTGPPATAPHLQVARANSLNHRRAGQNILYADTHGEFRKTAYSGFGYSATSPGDNIYTALAEMELPEQPAPAVSIQGVLGMQYSPAWKADSYLVPTAEDDRR
jgi:type II secretory pathway pseudopilin PulG